MATKVQLIGEYHVVQLGGQKPLHVIRFASMKERCEALRGAADWMLANGHMSPMDLIRCDEQGAPVECTPAADLSNRKAS